MSEQLSDITLLIDAVIFQLQEGKPLGISNVWRNLLQSISLDNRLKKVIVLDRGNTPHYPNMEYIHFPKFQNNSEDIARLEVAYKEHQADIFISSYFSYAQSSYNICFLHDFIPEKTGMNLNSPDWVNKMHSLEKGNGYIGVSETTLKDLRELHPRYSHRPQKVVCNSVSKDFKLHSQQEIERVKEKYKITKKYFLIVGQRMSYKNTIIFFKAFADLENQQEFEIVCVGGYERIEYILRFYLKGFKNIIRISPDNADLSTLLSGAEALTYPSLYEGFGMPIIEAAASGCPVIVSKQASACIEVGEDAVLTIDGHNVTEMRLALIEVQKPETRRRLIEAGLQKVKKYNCQASLEQFYEAIADNIQSMRTYYRNKT